MSVEILWLVAFSCLNPSTSLNVFSLLVMLKCDLCPDELMTSKDETYQFKKVKDTTQKLAAQQFVI